MHIHTILWLAGDTPGESGNVVSNEAIVANLRVAQVWPLLNTATL